MKSTTTPYIALIYGFIVIMLGYMGWKNVGSLSSFVMGGIFGLLTMVSSLFILQRKKWAEWTTFAFVVILMSIFSVRSYLTHRFIPIVMSLFSTLLIILLLLKIFKKESKK